MKQASAAALSILSGSKYLLQELYDITLLTGATYYFTSGQVPVSAAVYPSTTKNAYGSGLVLIRGDITQKVGVEGGSMKLTVVPVLNPLGGSGGVTMDSTVITADSTLVTVDASYRSTLVNGYPFLQACHLGFLDGAIVRMSKLFCNMPAPGALLDTSPAAIGYFEGTIEHMEVGRFKAELTIDDYLVYMNNQQMPRNVFTAGCGHRFLDKGCDPSGTVRTASTVLGAAIVAATDGAHFTTNLTQADGYFDLGYVTFTSGANQGFSGTITSYLHASGQIALKFPMPAPLSAGDTFNAVRGCDLSVASCNARSNLAHNMSIPFMPVPETILDGGTDNPPAQNIGAQAGQIISSQPTGQGTYGPYHP